MTENYSYSSSIWQEEMKTMREKADWAYRSPLPKKKQRTVARAERCGKCKQFSAEEILVENLRRCEAALNLSTKETLCLS